MQIEEAFKILDLPLYASPDDIQSAYRHRSKNLHPDLDPEGNGEAQADLNTAYRVARDYASLEKRLSAVGRSQLVGVNKGIRATSVAINALTAGESEKRRRTRIWRSFRAVCWVLGALGGGLFLIGEKAEIILPYLIPQAWWQSIRPELPRLSLTLWGLGLIPHLLVKLITFRIDSITERFSDRKECAAELARRLSFEDREHFLVDELSYATETGDNPLRLLNSALGLALESRSVLLKKAEGHGLITEDSEAEVRPDSVERYQVHFSPSLFKPEPEPPPPKSTRKDHRGSIGCGLMILLVFGGSAAFVATRGLWILVVLLAFFALGGLGFIVEGISGLWRLRSEERNGGRNEQL